LRGTGAQAPDELPAAGGHRRTELLPLERAGAQDLGVRGAGEWKQQGANQHQLERAA
jgi:hypothetical protein